MASAYTTLLAKRFEPTSGNANLFKTNPAAYQAIIQHYKEHEMAMQAKIAPQPNIAPPQGAQGGNVNG